MSLTGEVQTLYKDREKTRPVFPTTKTKAISDDNGVGLDALIENVIYSGIDNPEAAAAPVDADSLGGRLASEYATENFVAVKIAEAQMEGADVDLSGYVTKDELTSTINNINYPVDSVNGKTDAVNLSAADVGARPDTWLPTLAEIGAQKLIGVGSYTGDLNDYTTLMNTVAWVNGNSAANSPSTNYGVVETWGNGSGIVIQRFTSTSGSVVTRLRYNGTWTEWEWENPPFTTGKEYRTTKRVGGLVVYTKRFNFGTLPNTSAKRVQIPDYIDSYSMQNIQFIAKHNSIDNSMQLAYSAENGCFIEEQSNDIINIVVDTDIDMSAYSGYVTIEYTK